MDRGILDPRDTYDDAGDWDEKARKLAGLFIENFEKYADIPVGRELVTAGPTLH